MRRVAPIICSGVIALACGLGDLFKSSALAPVVITYQGDTILFRGTTVPFAVSVTADGTPVSAPRLKITSSDTNTMQVTAHLDSLVAKKQGFVSLMIVVENSMFTDSAPALVQPLRVRP